MRMLTVCSYHRTQLAVGIGDKEKPMRTRRKVTSIAVLLAFQGWMYLVAGMMSPSKVAAQGCDPFAERLVRAQTSEVSLIISRAINAQSAAIEQIVECSIAARPAAADIVVSTAIQQEPTEANRVTAAAIRGLSAAATSQSPPAQTAQQEQTAQQVVTTQQFEGIGDAFGDFQAALGDLLGAIGDLCDAFEIECPPIVVSPSF